MAVILTLFSILSCTAQSPVDRVTVFKRAQSLDNGISISWLEQTWNNNIFNKDAIKASDFQLLKQLGFKSIRLPVAFGYFQANSNSQQKILGYVDQVFKLCQLYGFRLIICYHPGNLSENTNLPDNQKVIDLWVSLAKKYIHENANNLFFELYNEPPAYGPEGVGERGQ